MEKVTIIIAAYNEENNIAQTIESVRKVMPSAEILVVDDGSSDRTSAVAKNFEGPLMKVVTSPKNFGKGHAIRTGIEHATGTIMAQIDADLQFPAEGLPNLIRPILEGKADIVFGSRYLPGHHIEDHSVSFIKRLASNVMALFISTICFKRYTDVFAGFKSWRAESIRKLNLREDDFTYEAEIAIKAKRNRLHVIEIPTDYKKRVAGKSNIKLLYHTISITWRILCITFSSQK